MLRLKKERECWKREVGLSISNSCIILQMAVSNLKSCCDVFHSTCSRPIAPPPFCHVITLLHTLDTGHTYWGRIEMERQFRTAAIRFVDTLWCHREFGDNPAPSPNVAQNNGCSSNVYVRHFDVRNEMVIFFTAKCKTRDTSQKFPLPPRFVQILVFGSKGPRLFVHCVLIHPSHGENLLPQV